MSTILFNTFLAGVPLIIAGLGALLSQKAGVLNIAIEGEMLFGAFAATIIGLVTGSPLLALLTGILAGVAAAWIHVAAAIGLKANIFISGLGINLLSIGIIPSLSKAITGTRAVLRLPPGFSGAAFTNISGILLAAATTTGCVVLLYYSRYGLELHAAGSQPELLHRRGIPLRRIQSIALLLSGAAAGLAGALLVLRIEAYAPGMSAGRGWIALAAVFLGFENPFGLVAGALLFGFIDATASTMQIYSAIPKSLLIAMPYAITLIAFILSSAIHQKRQCARGRIQV